MADIGDPLKHRKIHPLQDPSAPVRREAPLPAATPQPAPAAPQPEKV